MRIRGAAAIVLAFGVGVDLLSFIGWSVPEFENPIAIGVIIGIAVLAMCNLRWGIAAVLLELLWGSHGHLLRVSMGDTDWSLRMGIFAAVLLATVWHLRTGAARQWIVRAMQAHPAAWPGGAFLATLVLAAILGALRHAWDQVFFDANAWIFLALAPAFLLAFRDAQHRAWLMDVFCAGGLYLILRTYVLLFLFTHDLDGTWIPMYQWVRDTRLGEITVSPGGFPRVFLPSMVLLFPVIALAGLRFFGRRDPFAIAVFGGGVATLLLSLSRSYWLAGLVLCVIGIVWISFRMWHGDLSQFRAKLRKVIGTVSVLGIATVVAVGIAIALVRLPYPKSLTTVGVGETLLARLVTDAAVSNRWQQLSPLRDTIRAHPFLGNGFGAAVTYATRDPRTLTAFPNGEYTTTAFEWGYLDDLLERGLVGLLAELWLIGVLIWCGIRTGSAPAAIALALLAIVVTHATSPYLNHPLGIGAMLLTFASICARNVVSSRPATP